MEFQTSLESSLEAIVSHATELLNHLKKPSTTANDAPFGPADPLEYAPQQVQLSRKKLLEAATKLTQVATPPERYLEHLSNSVSGNLPIRFCATVS